MTQAPTPGDRGRPELERRPEIEEAADEAPPELAREAARGRSARTPLLVLGSVALTVWLVAGLIAAVVILLWIFL